MIQTPQSASKVVSSLLVVALATGMGCQSAGPVATSVALAPGAGTVGPNSGAQFAAAAAAANFYSPADVEFMSGMIPHHAQAVLMAGWAPSHGARADVQTLCQRIVISQRDEIRMMQHWLADRNLEVPDSNATHHKMKMNGMTMDMLMPGMLTDEQLAALDKARGPQFDYLFLTGMIGHHQGAINMVHELFSHPGSGQEETVFRFATDVEADQTAEIHRMQIMLETVPR